MPTQKAVDAVVIGGGPGGYVCAIRLGQLGQKTILVERGDLGGVCLNWGCIPSKALIAAANFFDKLKHVETIGITVSDPRIDVGKLQSWKDGIVKKLTSSVRSLCRGNGVEVMPGTAKLVAPNAVEVVGSEGEFRLEAKKGIVLATGARTIEIPGFRFDGKTVIGAKEAISLAEVPKRLVVIGGGVIGLELGTVYAKLGAQLTVIELMPQLLPGVDADLVAVVEKKLKKLGAQIFTQAKAKSLEVAPGGARVRFEVGGAEQVAEADKVLVAVGMRPNSEALGLEAAGVKTDPKGFVPTDAEGRTNVRTIFAIGDVQGPPLLAHKAMKEGEIVAEVIAGKKAARDWATVPAAIFTDPEIATTGMSEADAKAAGHEVRVGRYPFAASGRALAVLETDGFVKVVIDGKTHQLLGVQIVGPDASDLISEGTLGLEMGAFVDDVGLTIHPHPTLSESVMEAMKASVGEAIHILNR